jgi:hypothetical protein
MKALLAIALILVSTVCFSQGIGFKTIMDTTIRSSCIVVGNTFNNRSSTGSSSIIIGEYARIVYSQPKYDTVKCIAIYLDNLQVKADSCIKVSMATEGRYEYKNEGCNMAGCVAIHYGENIEVPDFKVVAVIRKNRKEIVLKDIIQYK